MSTTSTPHPTDLRLKQHEAMALHSFKDHLVEVRLDQGLYRQWRCAKPQSSMFAFTVTTIPGRIIVNGDVGDLIVERCDDMIAWCRGSINSVDYFEQKVVRAIPTREYDEDMAEWWLDDLSARCEAGELVLEPDQRESLDSLRSVTENEHFFCDELYRSGLVDGCDFPNLRNYNGNFLWCREAIKFLLNASGAQIVKLP